MSHFHPGEIEIQRRLDARDDAERVGRIIASTIPPQVARAVSAQRLAVVASLDAQRRPWASLLTGPAGFIAAADEHLLRLAVSPGLDETLATNLGVHPDLGLLVIDPRTRLRLRVNGRGLLDPEGLFLHVLPAADRDAIEAHVAGCPRCVAFVQSYRETPRILRSATATELPADLAESLRRFLAERRRS